MKKLFFIFTVFIIAHCTFIIEDCICQWEPDVRLTNAISSSNLSFNNARNIAVNGNFVHVVWQDSRDGNLEIYYKRSTNGGTNWEADMRLTNAANSSHYSCVAVSGSVVHVVWRDIRDGNEEIYYKRSIDEGINWEADVRLTNEPNVQQNPSVAVSGSTVHVVWCDWRNGNTNLDIYYKGSSDGGVNWGTDTRLTNAAGDSWETSVAVSGSTVHVVWTDNRDASSGGEIYYKRSTDGGINWGADTRLTNNPGGTFISNVSVCDSTVHVVFYDNRDGNIEIYYKRSTNGGVNWEADLRLTNEPAMSMRPCIAVSGSNVHVVWNDNRDGNTEIYYKRSTDGGSNWGADVRLTNATGNSEYPSTAVSGSVVHVVWQDNRDGNYEIYYKRNLNGNPTKIVNINSEIPDRFALEQNYPNPFNSVTSIKFQVTMGSRLRGNDNVVLKVFDMLGREVATLVNEYLQPGTYEVRFDAGDLPSGIYFYRLTTEYFTETKILILLK